MSNGPHFEGEEQATYLHDSFLEDNEHLREDWEELQNLPLELLPIAAVASLESKLTELIECYLVDCGAARSLLGTSDDAEYGLEYVARVRLAEALGLIPSNIGDALKALGRIRNHFAHHPRPKASDARAKKALRKLHDELYKLIMGAILEDDEKAYEHGYRESQKLLESNLDELTFSSVTFGWLVLSILISRAAKRAQTRRLTPVITPTDLWVDTEELEALEREAFGKKEA